MNSKIWVKTFEMSYGHAQYFQNCPDTGLLHYFSERTRNQNGLFSHFAQLLQYIFFKRYPGYAIGKLTPRAF